MGDMSLPPDYPTIPPGVYDDAKLVKLARQIAMGIKDLPDILFDNSLTQREFAEIQQLPHFAKLLQAEVKAWEGAANTPERIKLKTASMIEEYLPELYARLNDPNEAFMAKIKGLEWAARMASLGERDISPQGNPGDKVQVIINLGADSKLVYDKQLPRKVIDVTPNPQQSFEESLDAGPNSI